VRELEEQNLALKDQLRMAQAEITQLHTQLAGVRTQKHQALLQILLPACYTLTIAVFSVADPGCLFRIPDTRIQGLKDPVFGKNIRI
jgi:hypothetical protein